MEILFGERIMNKFIRRFGLSDINTWELHDKLQTELSKDNDWIRLPQEYKEKLWSMVIEEIGDTIFEKHLSVMSNEIHKDDEPLVPKTKRGRPRKVKREPSPIDQNELDKIFDS